MKKQIRLGICMAGAVSAGAYTAGVMDYLIEALERLEVAKQNGEPDAQNVEIVIDVLAGASAGGMTALIAAAALHREEWVHVNHQNFRQSEAISKNPLFNCWIQLADDVDKVTIKKMCDTDDIDDKKVVESIFHSGFIEEIATKLIDETICGGQYKKRNFVADDLQIIACMTNLRGFPVTAKFKGNNQNDELHFMTQHRDFGHFEVCEGEMASMGRIPVNFKSPEKSKLQIYKDVAMATGAFPIGLKPRLVTRKKEWILKNPYINPEGNSLDEELMPEEDYSAVMVDGGAFNNEPYDIAWDVLEKRYKGSKYDYRVLMIDPIPSNVSFKSPFEAPVGLKNVAPKIIAALQAEPNKKLVKPEDYKMFLISPARKGAFVAVGNADDKKKENHIACGALNRFGGFFHKRFREHDYLLGRRNCKSFLMKHFKNDDETLVFPQSIFSQSIGTGDETFAMQRTIPYPKMHYKKLNEFEKIIKIRLDAVLPNLGNPPPDSSAAKIDKENLEMYFGKKGMLMRIFDRVKGWAVRLVLSKVDGAVANAFVNTLTLDLHAKQQLTLIATEDIDVPPTDAIGEVDFNEKLKFLRQT